MGTCYILKIVSDYKSNEIKNDFIRIFESLKKKITTSGIHEGLSVFDDGDLLLFEDDIHKTIKVKYEKEKIIRGRTSDREESEFLIPDKDYNVDIWIDLSTYIVCIFTSNITIARYIIRKIYNNSPKYFAFERLDFEDEFFRWIIKKKDNSRLLSVNKAKVCNCENTGEDVAIIGSIDGIRNSPVYKMIEDEGTRKYVQGMFNIKDLIVPVLVYTNGKFTLNPTGKKNHNELKDYTRFVFQEMSGLEKEWRNSLS